MKLLLNLFVALLAGQALALGEPKGSVAYENITATPISMPSESQTIIGQDFTYPSGNPLIKAFLIEVPPGKETALHRHSIPLIGYVLSGRLEVDYGSKGKHVVEAGNAFLEAIEWCHIGRALGDEPAILVGIYLSQTAPETALAMDCEKAD